MIYQPFATMPKTRRTLLLGDAAEELAIIGREVLRMPRLVAVAALSKDDGPLVVKQLAQFEDTSGRTQRHKLWATMVQELDHSVGMIVDEVRRLGIEQNTIIHRHHGNDRQLRRRHGRRQEVAASVSECSALGREMVRD